MIKLFLLIQLTFASDKSLEIGDKVIVTSGFYNNCVGTVIDQVNDDLYKIQYCYKDYRYQNVKFYIVDRAIISRLTR